MRKELMEATEDGIEFDPETLSRTAELLPELEEELRKEIAVKLIRVLREVYQSDFN